MQKARSFTSFSPHPATITNRRTQNEPSQSPVKLMEHTNTKTPTVRPPGDGQDEESLEERAERHRLRAEQREAERKRLERYGK
jgi:hypothetical protein